MWLKGYNKTSVEYIYNYLEEMRKRGYLPKSFLLRIRYSITKFKFIKIEDYNKFKIDVLYFLKYSSLWGNDKFNIPVLNLQYITFNISPNLDRYKCTFFVEFINAEELTLKIQDNYISNTFKNEIIFREVERYKKFLFTKTEEYKINIIALNKASDAKETDLINNPINPSSPIYYVNNLPEYVENQLDYTIQN
jgi:hypothetical protein